MFFKKIYKSSYFAVIIFLQIMLKNNFSAFKVYIAVIITRLSDDE